MINFYKILYFKVDYKAVFGKDPPPAWNSDSYSVNDFIDDYNEYGHDGDRWYNMCNPVLEKLYKTSEDSDVFLSPEDVDYIRAKSRDSTLKLYSFFYRLHVKEGDSNVDDIDYCDDCGNYLPQEFVDQSRYYEDDDPDKPEEHLSTKIINNHRNFVPVLPNERPKKKWTYCFLCCNFLAKGSTKKHLFTKHRIFYRETFGRK